MGACSSSHAGPSSSSNLEEDSLTIEFGWRTATRSGETAAAPWRAGADGADGTALPLSSRDPFTVAGAANGAASDVREQSWPLVPNLGSEGGALLFRSPDGFCAAPRRARAPLAPPNVGSGSRSRVSAGRSLRRAMAAAARDGRCGAR